MAGSSGSALRTLRVKALSNEVRDEVVVPRSKDLAALPRGWPVWASLVDPIELVDRVERLDCEPLVNLVREPALCVLDETVERP